MKKILTALVATVIGCSVVTAPLIAVAQHKDTETVATTKTTVASVQADTKKFGSETVFEDIVENGKTFKAVYYVTPSQKVKKYSGGKVVLNEAGEYSVRYEAQADNKNLIKDVKFTVYSELYTIGKNSSASYGKIANDYYENRVKRIDSTGALKDKEGLKLSISPGEIFTYNRVLDLKKSDFNKPVMSMFCLPENLNESDAKRIHLKLTDLYDADNYIEMYLTWNDATTGWQNLTSVQIGFNGNVSHKSHWSPGAAIEFSMDLDEPRSHGNIFSMLYDNANLALGCSPAPYNTGRDGSLIPFSDPEITDKYTSYPEAWKGFTTGECVLTIEGVSVTANALNLIIYDIYGDDLKGDVWINDSLPQFTVDFKGYEELPNAKTGVSYKLFEARSFDDREVKTDVYYNYDSDNPVKINIKDGCFVPSFEGVYTVIYSLTNEFGNTNTLIKEVYADGKDAFKFSIDGKLFKGKSGTTVKVFDAVNSADICHGKVDFEMKAVHKRSGKVYEISDDYTFLPMDAGAYEIIVTGKDYVTIHTEKFVAEIFAGNEPVFFEDAVVPDYLIKDATYPLPKLEGYVFSSGNATAKIANVSVYADGKSVVEDTANGNYTVKAESEVKFVFTLTDGDNSISKEYVVPVVDTGYADVLNASAYFKPIIGSATIANSVSAVNLSANTYVCVSGKTETQFINAVQTHSFVTDFNTVQGKTEFERLNIYLRDLKFDDNYIKISIFKNDSGSCMIKVNDSAKSYAMPENAFNPNDTNLSVGYSSEKRAVVVNDRSAGTNFNIPVTRNCNGNPFDGFYGERARLSFEFEGVTGEASLNVVSINGQRFGALEEDFNPPQYFIDVNNGLKLPGTEMIIPKADVCDVLDPNVSIKLTVTDPNGNTVVSADGISLSSIDSTQREYKFILESEGMYNLTYTVSDGSVTRNYLYTVTVKGNTVPVINFDGEMTKEAKVGEIVQLVKATVSEGAELKIYISAPGSSKLETITGYSGFKATQKGIYIVRYVASDANGNFVSKTFTVTVK